MFDLFFRRRQASKWASKCKKLIKQVQCRLKWLKNRRCSMVRLLRKDIADLIKIGNEEIAFNRAEQLFKYENTVAVYELLDSFCEFILMNLSFILECKDCPKDINEAVSSLIFASSRCGDLPELYRIRKLFEDRYGKKFVMAAAEELFPGNLVNHQIKERLNLKSVADDIKQQLVDEIAKDNCLRTETLAIEYAPEYNVDEIAKDNCLRTETLAIEYAPEYNVFTWVNEQIQVTTGKVKESYSPSKCTSCLTGKGTAPPYLTVKTMPPEWPKETRPDNILRCNSLAPHVHPKLPDYDHIVAEFMAHKKEHLGDQR
ncbi:hypothetical protein LWI29_033920 [Acer saccharum]|uniref:IST1-like protein n=1 Tax=Acer saccharum TaxID=4024 RepID=A0AA39TZF7_ACESA|nr:hypothetical protein LWI29_033920 [Acer saccharum]